MTSYDQCSAIAELDLEPIKFKLMHKEGWTPEQAEAVEREYRRFLFLMKIYPQDAAAPLEDVDTFWHYHILDTMKYARDCETVFGYFLHHFPYVGLCAEAGPDVLEQMGERMRELYEVTFGQSYRRQTSQLQGQAVPSPASDPALAYCAAPARPRSAGAGPMSRPRDTNVAYCAAPARPLASVSSRRPHLTGHAQAAYCAAPARQERARPALDRDTVDLTVAYCAAPARPATLAREAAAALA